MNRKWMVMVWTGVLALPLLALGCKSAPPPPPPPAPETTENIAPAPTTEVEAPPATSTETDPDEWLLSEDIQFLNDEAVKRGLLGDVYFDFDRYELRQDALDRLAKNAEFMRDNPDLTFDIEGHCDERGTNDYNLALGDRRASAARGYLSSLGVASSIRTISYGEERPLCSSSSESCWSQNRRAHFVITGHSG